MSAHTTTRRPKYPKPHVPYRGYSDLYFATERQMRSPFSVANFDRGEISLSPGRVTFRGMEALVDCVGVTAVAIVRKTFPWGVALGIGVIAVIIAAFQAPTFLSWRHPFPYVLLGVFVVACLSQSRERWVEVSYAAPEGPRRAYFRRQPHFFGSSRARTATLLKEIETVALASVTAARGGRA